MPSASGQRLPNGWLRLWLGVWMAGMSLAAAQDGRDATEEALDQNVSNINISKVPVREALAMLQRSTNVRFEISDACVELLPYGARTRVNIMLANIPLRQGLTQIFDGLGLTMSVAGPAVQIEPAPVLRRLGRRMKIAEVELLNRLAEKPWAEVRSAGGVPLQFEIPSEAKPTDALQRTLAQVPGMSALRQLEAAAATLGWVWLPRDGAVVFHTRRDFFSTLLDRPMAFNYQKTPLDELIEDIGRRAGVRIAFEPGVLAQVSACDRRVDLVTPKGSARQMLDRLCGNIGLRYDVNDEGVRVFRDADAAATTQPAGTPNAPLAPAPRVIAMIRMPLPNSELSVDFLVREDELPADIVQLRRDKLDEVIARIREAFAPPAAPAARP
jgi:hypothetical protein